MYLIKSLLPCDANVLIKTEEFQRENSLKVPGRGALSNLYTPGTTAHHHSLTFHIELVYFVLLIYLFFLHALYM